MWRPLFCDHALSSIHSLSRFSERVIASINYLRKKESNAMRLRTLIPPPSSAPCEAGEATTCTLSVAHGLGATRRSSGAFSAST